MTHYTAGFAFHGGSVLLIHKKRGPPGVRGRINGIGGHIEEGEIPIQCQRREFREETGLDIPEDRWVHTVTLGGPNGGGWVVIFFKTTLTDEEVATFTTAEDEKVALYDVREIPELPVVPNLRWLIPIQLDHHLQWPVVIMERGT
jgi:8-oxo-dGTP diphosphatase